ncbi:hypothetical protein AZE42_05297 [Rhizopogon vesiculosus]|uniref:Uncharacterized protein n=1 Tax=Rhizopogon vesiculosus TaxID=180088 RepID=A0A1J8R8W6_9AGAM|nr:hypothetical protein AZE42_05297 [Rhizopogon vesiculosus]
MRMSTIAGPITIIIDALDETLPKYRKEVLLLLSRGANFRKVPVTGREVMMIRIIVTSRPVTGIHKSLRWHSHIRQIDMANISPASAYCDIEHYFSTTLADLPGDSRLSDEGFEKLTGRSEGVFEWVCLACEYIHGETMGLDPVRRCQAVLTGTTSNGKLKCMRIP